MGACLSCFGLLSGHGGNGIDHDANPENRPLLRSGARGARTAAAPGTSGMDPSGYTFDDLLRDDVLMEEPKKLWVSESQSKLDQIVSQTAEELIDISEQEHQMPPVSEIMQRSEFYQQLLDTIPHVPILASSTAAASSALKSPAAVAGSESALTEQSGIELPVRNTLCKGESKFVIHPVGDLVTPLNSKAK